MKDAFIITSALTVDYGSYSIGERMSQLIQTINSIKTHSTDSDIFLCDVSPTPIDSNHARFLASQVTELQILSGNEILHFFKDYQSNDTNLTARKTVGELVAMSESLSLIKSTGNTYRRIFKISGRYMLTPKFKDVDYEALTGNIVVKEKQYWYTCFVYITRLWSFDFAHLDLMLGMFTNMKNSTSSALASGSNAPVLEAGMYENIQNLNIPVIEVKNIGVEGTYGQNGVYLNE